jgi:hypothetical protein
VAIRKNLTFSPALASARTDAAGILYTRMDEQPRKPRRRWWKIALCAIVLALCDGEWLASRAISSKLRWLVERKLDAHLELGPVLYFPPYGAIAWGAKLTRDGRELVTLAKLNVTLAQNSLAGGPVVISSLSLDTPVVNLAPGAFAGIVKPSAKELAPRNLSEILLLRALHLNSGRITYSDPRTSDPPMVWDNLAMDADLSQRSSSQYRFRLISKAAPLVDTSAAGTIDVDSLLLEVQNLSLHVRAEPEPARTPLPAAVQRFLKQYRVTGSVAVTGNGTIPLRDPHQAAWTLSIALRAAAALVPPQQSMLEHAEAALVCRKQPDGPIEIDLTQIDIAGEGKQVVFDTGHCAIDDVAGTWSAADVKGHVLILASSITTAAVASTRPASAPPLVALPTTSPIDRLRPAGRLDFTAAASGPFNWGGKKPWEAIQHEVIAYPRGFSFQPKGFAGRVEEINGGEVRMINGMIIFQELRGRYGSDDLGLRAARLPVEGLPKLARWQEISGTIRFNPPQARYTPSLDKVFDALHPAGPYLVAGSYTLDHTGPEMRKLYELMISSDSGAMTLTEKQIEFSKIRGDATVTTEGVEIHSVAAQVLGGRTQLSGRWEYGETAASYNWDVSAQDLDLAAIDETFSQTPRDKPLKGRVHGELSLEGAGRHGNSRAENLKLLNGEGQFEVVDGSLFQLPVLKHIGQRVRGFKEISTVGDAAGIFEIGGGEVRFREAAVNSPMLGLQGSGSIAMNGALNLNVVAAPLADWRDKLKESRIPLIGDLAGDIAGGIQKILNSATGALLYAFRIEGTVNDVKVTAVPAPALTDAAASVFGKMLAPPKGGHPIDLLDHPQVPATAPSPQAAKR